ncbi:MAG: nitric oxide reductase activation protein NorD [Hydrogenophaga sp.]|uniref:nitric oxide reductase activation protein NorD n=1 Tax=Hydrogenophaga sp. TaxID=1904254 RepID=UPI003D0CE450
MIHAVDQVSQVRRVARALWGQPLQTAWQIGELHPDRRAVLMSVEGADPVLHLPGLVDGSPDLWLATAAHAAAHLRFGDEAQSRKGLKPVQQALLGVLEDARVEWLALQELPGLRAVWWSYHADAAALRGASFEDLLARLSASLLDPAHDDPHAWVARVRRVFFEPDGHTLALRTPSQVREAASLLGNDIGQMRLPFNVRTYAVHARYRDDNTHLWLPDDSLPPSDTTLQADTAPPTDEAPAATPEPSRTEPDAVHAEWDHRIGRYRPRWCRVYGGGGPSGPPAWPPGALAQGQRQLAQRLGAMAGPWRRGSGRSSDGDELHHAALIDSALDLRGLRTPDPRVHRRPWRPTPPLAVLLLLDASASTDRSDAQGGDLLERMQRSAATASLALQRLGHRSGLWAFSSQGRHRIDMPCLKHWDEDLPALTRLRGGGSTRLGAALRHALRLCEQDARDHPGWQRVVMVLTDGEPHDIDVHDPDYLPADLLRVTREARVLGVALRALVFQPGDAGPLRAAFGRGNVRSATTPGSLAPGLTGLLATVR